MRYQAPFLRFAVLIALIALVLGSPVQQRDEDSLIAARDGVINGAPIEIALDRREPKKGSGGGGLLGGGKKTSKNDDPPPATTKQDPPSTSSPPPTSTAAPSSTTKDSSSSTPPSSSSTSASSSSSSASASASASAASSISATDNASSSASATGPTSNSNSITSSASASASASAASSASATDSASSSASATDNASSSASATGPTSNSNSITSSASASASASAASSASTTDSISSSASATSSITSSASTTCSGSGTAACTPTPTSCTASGSGSAACSMTSSSTSEAACGPACGMTACPASAKPTGAKTTGTAKAPPAKRVYLEETPETPSALTRFSNFVKRTLPHPSNGQDTTAWILDMFKNGDVQGDLLGSSDPDPNPVAKYWPFADKALNAGVDGLYGCTSVVIASRAGVWASHFYETVGFQGTTKSNKVAWGQFEKYVLNTIAGTEKVSGFTPVPGIQGNPWDLGNDVQILISTPSVQGAAAIANKYKYPQQVSAIQDQLRQSIPGLQSSDITTWAYNIIPGSSSDRATKLASTGLGKVLITYDPNADDQGDKGYQVWAEINSAMKDTWGPNVPDGKPTLNAPGSSNPADASPAPPPTKARRFEA